MTLRLLSVTDRNGNVQQNTNKIAYSRHILCEYDAPNTPVVGSPFIWGNVITSIVRDFSYDDEWKVWTITTMNSTYTFKEV